MPSKIRNPPLFNPRPANPPNPGFGGFGAPPLFGGPPAQPAVGN
jgi:hypothetical protein